MSGYLGTVGALGAFGVMGTSAALPVALGAATYASLAGIANYSLGKKLLGYFTKDLSSSAYKHLSDKAQEALTRGGFFLTDEGVFDYKPKPKPKKIGPLSYTDKEKSEDEIVVMGASA